MACKNIGAIIIVLSIIYGYRLYKPLPKNVTSPWESTKLFALLAALDDVAYVGSMLGFGSRLNITRTVMESTSSTFNNMPTDKFTVEDTVFSGVKVRIYKPKLFEEEVPAIVFYHGGGFVMCNLEVHDPILRMISNQMNVVIVSVDYRLAPENPYPIPLNDCMKATIHFIERANEYRVNPERIGIMGDSAGGNLAAAVSLKLRDAQYKRQPKLQVLVYPLLQGFDLKLPSMLSNSDIAYGSRKGIASCLVRYAGLDEKYIPLVIENQHISPKIKQKYSSLVDRSLLPSKYLANKDPDTATGASWNQDLSEMFEDFITDPYAMPLMASDLSNLPQTYIATVEFDTLRDEGIIYAKRLEKHGVTVMLIHYDDAFHSVFNMIQPPIKIEAGVKMVTDLISYLHKYL